MDRPAGGASAGRRGILAAVAGDLIGVAQRAPACAAGGLRARFCIGLVVAGVASALVGLVQVFAPHSPDGNWIALAALAGRAAGNLRQPNHLSSLLLWSVVAVVWLVEAKPLRRPHRLPRCALVLRLRRSC